MDYRFKCKHKIIKLIEEIIGCNIQDLKFGERVLRHDTKSKIQKRKILISCITIKNFCCTKYHMKRMKRQATDWDEIFANHMSYKELISRI